MNLQQSLTQAVKAQAAREGISYMKISNATGISYSALLNRMTNKYAWNSDQLAKVAKALRLSSEWDLIRLAEQEEKSPQVQAAGDED